MLRGALSDGVPFLGRRNTGGSIYLSAPDRPDAARFLLAGLRPTGKDIESSSMACESFWQITVQLQQQR